MAPEVLAVGVQSAFLVGVVLVVRLEVLRGSGIVVPYVRLPLSLAFPIGLLLVRPSGQVVVICSLGALGVVMPC